VQPTNMQNLKTTCLLTDFVLYHGPLFRPEPFDPGPHPGIGQLSGLYISRV